MIFEYRLSPTLDRRAGRIVVVAQNRQQHRRSSETVWQRHVLDGYGDLVERRIVDYQDINAADPTPTIPTRALG